MRSDKDFLTFLKGMLKGKTLIFMLAVVALVALVIHAQSQAAVDEVEAPVSEESELSELCSSVAGVGRCRVTVVLDSDGSVSAVAVVCEGGDSLTVRARLTELITTLYGIGSNRVSIMKLGK